MDMISIFSAIFTISLIVTLWFLFNFIKTKRRIKNKLLTKNEDDLPEINHLKKRKKTALIGIIISFIFFIIFVIITYVLTYG